MSTQVDLFTNVEPTSVSPAIAKPFVSRSTFYQGDCLVEMDKIADKSVDMILCDLPYGTTACKWDSVIPFEPLWKQYERIIKDNGAIVLFASQPFTSKLVSSNISNFSHQWIWEKIGSNGNPLLANKMPLKNFEDVLVFGKICSFIVILLVILFFKSLVMENEILQTSRKDLLLKKIKEAATSYELFIQLTSLEWLEYSYYKLKSFGDREEQSAIIKDVLLKSQVVVD